MRVLLRAIGEGKPDAPEQILARWTWKLARAVRKVLDRKASAEYPEAKRLLGALANSRGQRHEENAVKLARAAEELPIATAAALLASAEGYTPRANRHLEAAREKLGDDPGGRERARRRPARAEGAPGPQAPPPPQEEAQRCAGTPGRRAGAGAQSGSGRQREAAARRICNNRAGFRDRIDSRWSLAIVLAFMAGVITAVSPCVLPVLPIVLARRRRRATSAGRSRSSPASRVSFLVSVLFAAWMLDKLGLPKDLLRNISIGLLFLMAAT